MGISANSDCASELSLAHFEHILHLDDDSNSAIQSKIRARSKNEPGSHPFLDDLIEGLVGQGGSLKQMVCFSILTFPDPARGAADRGKSGCPA
jgi:hypothetical protein